MITLHHLNNSRSQRVLWLLEELELDYEIKFYNRDPKTMLAPSDLKKIHPLGKSPVITDGQLTIAESGTIINYLATKYGNGKLKPSSEINLLKYDYWLHYSEGSLMPFLLLTLIFSKVEKAPFPIRPVAKAISGKVKKSFITPNLTTHLDYIESELAKSEWFAGKDFSAADIQMSFPLEAASARHILGDRTHIKKYLTRIHARPAYKKALEKGGEYSILN